MTALDNEVQRPAKLNRTRLSRQSAKVVRTLPLQSNATQKGDRENPKTFDHFKRGKERKKERERSLSLFTVILCQKTGITHVTIYRSEIIFTHLPQQVTIPLLYSEIWLDASFESPS